MPGPDPYGIEIGPDYPEQISVLVYRHRSCVLWWGQQAPPDSKGQAHPEQSSLGRLVLHLV